MERQQLFDKVLSTFDNNDTEGLINLVTDDFEWDMVGSEIIKGKDKLKEMFAASDGGKMLSVTKELKFIDGDKAVCKGVVVLQNGDGEKTEQFYCDLYEFQGNKLKKMSSYIIEKNSPRRDIRS